MDPDRGHELIGRTVRAYFEDRDEDGDSATQTIGEVVGYHEEPVVVIRRDDGSVLVWPARLVETGELRWEPDLT